MKWNKKSGYLDRISAETTLKNFLGLRTLDYYVDKEVRIDIVDKKDETLIKNEEIFIPYYTYIMKYLNEKLILLGDTDIKSRVEKIFKIFELGAEKIAHKATLDLVRAVGIETDNLVEDENNILYDQDRFVFAWSSFMTFLYLRLKLQYASLFKEEYDGECCRCGAKGQTESDYESWTSKVYPEDELYDRSILEDERSTTAWGTSVTRYCDCYRK